MNGHRRVLLRSDETLRDAWEAFIRARSEGLLKAPLNNERTARLNAADVELDLLREFEAVLGQTRNKLTPVGALPAEVLCLIFSYAQKNWQPQRRNMPITQGPGVGETIVSRKQQYDIGWIKITHVCHVWRQVSLIRYSDMSMWY